MKLKIITEWKGFEQHEVYYGWGVLEKQTIHPHITKLPKS